MKKKLFVTFFNTYSNGLVAGIVEDTLEKLLLKNIAIYDYILEVEYDSEKIRNITVDEKNFAAEIQKRDTIRELKKELEALENEKA